MVRAFFCAGISRAVLFSNVREKFRPAREKEKALPHPLRHRSTPKRSKAALLLQKEGIPPKVEREEKKEDAFFADHCWLEGKGGRKVIAKEAII